VFDQLAERLTKKKLASALPVLGILIGAGLNAQLVHKVADDADLAYRTRFLADKYGLDITTLLPIVESQPPEEDVIDIEALIEEDIGTDESPDS
jgi:hypothetical protein